MVRSLRISHLKIFYVLGCVLPLLFVLGIALRYNTYFNHNYISKEHEQAVKQFQTVVISRLFDSKNNQIWLEIRKHNKQKSIKNLQIILKPLQAYKKPDILVYLSQISPESITNFNPQDKFYLGDLQEQEKNIYILTNSHQYMRKPTYFIFYSTVFRQVVDYFLLDMKTQE